MTEDRENGNKRITLELTSEAYDRLELLMAKVNLTSYAQLFRHALQLYDWAVDERELDRQIGSMDSSKRFYLLISFNDPRLEEST